MPTLDQLIAHRNKRIAREQQKKVLKAIPKPRRISGKIYKALEPAEVSDFLMKAKLIKRRAQQFNK